MNTMPFFFNHCIDKGRLKRMILWSLTYQGEHKTLQLIENLKTLGFKYATYAGVSLSIDDLSIPPKKKVAVLEAEGFVAEGVQGTLRGDRSAIEGLQSVIDTWHRTSENVKDHVIDYFEATNILNPVYMMAFSGARGNVSQVRQLVGMRGLMADPNGNIIGYPIRSNFREGLTVTEYMISCYGARKGVVDTALRTADAGYLTRRLVDVAQHVVVQKGSCGTRRGITMASLYDGRKRVISLADRLLGRVLAADIVEGQKVLGVRNQAISESFALRLSQLSEQADPRAPLTITVRSPLTCDLTRGVCQLCYGWSLAQSSLVTLGEAVGVIAGQSIGEPGTQLTMRTFHTGGVFTGDVQDEFRSPHAGVVHFPEPLHGLLVRTSYGQISFLVKVAGTLLLVDNQRRRHTRIHIPVHTALFAREGEFVQSNQLLGQFGDLDNQQNERVKTRKIVASLRDGEVIFQKGGLSERGLSAKALQTSYLAPTALGTLWVLAGKYLTQNHRLLPVFKTSGHIVEAQSLLRRVSILSNIEGFITHWPTSGLEGHTPQNYRLFPPTPIDGSGALSSGPKEHRLRLPVFGATRTVSTPYSHVLERRLFSNGSQETFVLLNAKGSLTYDGRPSSKPSSLRGLKAHKSKEFTPVSLLYFHDYFKTQGGGELWFDPSLLSVKHLRGFLFWVPSLQKNNSRIKRSSGARLHGWQQRRAPGVTKAPTPRAVSRPLQGLRWVQKNEPLYTMHTVQGKQKTYNAAVSGLLQYKTQETRKALEQRNTVQVAAPPQLNPLAKSESRFYEVTQAAARLTTPKYLTGHFPFPHSSVRCPLQTKLGIHPGWVFLPALTAFNHKILSTRSALSSYELPHFDDGRVTFTPFLLNTARVAQSTAPCAPDSTQTPRSRKLYTWVTKNTHRESLELPFLGRLRALACLRHPHLLKGTFLRTKEITEQVGVFSVFHYAQSPLYGLFAPSSLHGRTARLSFSAFTGWVYSRSNVLPPRGSPQGLVHVKKYTAKNISSYHVKSTLIFLYRSIQEYSLSRVIGIKNKLQWYQNFEQNGYMDLRDVSHRTRTLLPLWSKQHRTATRLEAPVKLFRVSSRMLSVKSYAPAPTFILRFVVDLGLAGAPLETPIVTCEAPWNAATTHGLGWNLSFYQKPARGEDSLLGPCHGMILAGQSGFVRQVPGVAEGEVYTRSDKKCILLRPADSRSFQVPRSQTEGSPPYKVSVGQMVRYGDEICPGIAAPESGQVVAIEGAYITLRKGQPVLFYKTGTVLHVKDGQWLDLGQPLVTLTYQRLVTGDIVQGIPKVEQVFEASPNRQIKGNLKQLLSAKFEAFKQKTSYPLATRQSLDFIQKEIIERIQKIYLSQGVSISDKHFEIIVRQMTSTVKVVDPGETGLFRDEKVSLNRVENMNLTIRKEDKGQPGLPTDRMARYEPILVGISEMALNSNSFLAAASFQETTRILTRDSILRKTDFLRGLKERVILGDLIPAGTGLPEVIAYRTAPSEPGDFYWEPSPMEFTEIFSNLEDPAWEPIASEGPEDSPTSAREKFLALLLKKK